MSSAGLMRATCYAESWKFGLFVSESVFEGNVVSLLESQHWWKVLGLKRGFGSGRRQG